MIVGGEWEPWASLGRVYNGTHQGRTSSWRQFRRPNMRCLPQLQFRAHVSTSLALGGLAIANMQALAA